MGWMISSPLPILLKKNICMHKSKTIHTILIFLTALLCLTGPGAVMSQDIPAAPGACLTTLDKGSVNWSTGMVTVKGEAAPLKDKKKNADTIFGEARADASRNIIELLKQIRISADLPVGTYAADKDIIMAGIEKTAMDARITRQLYSSDGALKLTLETSIYGGFLQLVIPETIRQIPKITPAEPQTDPLDATIDHTGLIIDASDIDFSPVIYPVILDEQGRELYSSAFISREYAVQNGIVTYVCSLKAAMKSKRIGIHPMVLKGLRVGEATPSSIIINMSDTNRLEEAVERHHFLKECRVIIVLAK